MEDNINVFDVIDFDKGGYAIEMEVSCIQYPGLVALHNQIHKTYTPINWTNIGERCINELNIKSSDIKKKSKFYALAYDYLNHGSTYAMGMDTYTSGGVHMHVFFKKLETLMFLKNLSGIADNLGIDRLWDRLLVSTPFSSKCNANGSYHRRPCHAGTVGNMSITNYKESNLSDRPLFNSMEFRYNDVIHPFQFLYYSFLVDLILTNKIGILNLGFSDEELGKIYQGCQYKLDNTNNHGYVKPMNIFSPNIRLAPENNNIIKLWQNNMDTFYKYISSEPHWKKFFEENKYYNDYIEWSRNYYNPILSYRCQ